MHGERQVSGEITFTVSLVLKPKEMLRSDEIQKSFRPELSRQSDEIQLVPLVKEYFHLHGAIMKAVICMHLPRLIETSALWPSCVDENGTSTRRSRWAGDHDAAVVPDELPNLPHLELDMIGHFALAKIKEAVLALTGG